MWKKFYSLSLIFISAAFLFADNARSYSISVTPDGKSVRWARNQKFNLAGNPTGNHSLHPQFFWNSVVSALMQWQASTQGKMQWDYWQGTNPDIFKTRLAQDGLSKIFFASRGNAAVDPNVIGYTLTTFNALDGTLLQTETYMNDIHYHFTEIISDTSSRTMNEPRPKVYFPNLVSHELGHAIGMDHSEQINSSMLYVEYLEQNLLSCDDQAGAKHIYGNGDKSMASGKVLIEGKATAGIVVTAISLDHGIPMGSTKTNADGSFFLQGLEPSRAAFLVDPSSLSNCNGLAPPRQWIASPNGVTATLSQLNPGALVQLPQKNISCFPTEKQSISTIADGMYLFSAGSGSQRTFKYNSSGSFQAMTLGYLIRSPMLARIELFDSAQRPVPSDVISPIYQSESGFRIDDFAIQSAAIGEIQLNVQAVDNDFSNYPGPAAWPQGESQVLLLVRNQNNRSPASTTLANARCSIPHDVSSYQSPPGNPVINSPGGTSREAIGFCGTIRKNDNFPSAPPSAVISWFLPFLIAAFSTFRYKIKKWINS